MGGQLNKPYQREISEAECPRLYNRLDSLDEQSLKPLLADALSKLPTSQPESETRSDTNRTPRIIEVHQITDPETYKY